MHGTNMKIEESKQKYGQRNGHLEDLDLYQDIILK